MASIAKITYLQLVGIFKMFYEIIYKLGSEHGTYSLRLNAESASQAALFAVRLSKGGYVQSVRLLEKQSDGSYI